MTKFEGNVFMDVSVPLIFEGRYFILDSVDPAILTVVLEHGGQIVCEVLENEPQENPCIETKKTHTGIVTVSDRESGMFLYKIRPGSETTIVFGKLDGDKIFVKITNMHIIFSGVMIQNNKLIGNQAGVTVDPKGGFGLGGTIPQVILDWLHWRTNSCNARKIENLARSRN